MFLGHYDHTIDEKGRLTIPARYRDQLDPGAYITLGFDRNLVVMNPPLFDDLAVRASKMNQVDPAARALNRLFFSFAQQLETDRAGRILIPPFLRQQIGLGSNAVVAGVGDHFEIWEPETWAKHAALLQDPDFTAQRLASLDFSPS